MFGIFKKKAAPEIKVTDGDTMLYVVADLRTQIQRKDENGITVTIKIGACYGYLPVFETLEEAEKSGRGECEIFGIQRK